MLICTEILQYFAIMDMGEPVTITAKQSRFAASTFTTYLVRVEVSWDDAWDSLAKNLQFCKTRANLQSCSHLQSNFPTLSHKFCTVRRRYTEFCWLRDELVKNNRNRWEFWSNLSHNFYPNFCHIFLHNF